MFSVTFHFSALTLYAVTIRYVDTVYLRPLDGHPNLAHGTETEKKLRKKLKTKT